MMLMDAHGCSWMLMDAHEHSWHGRGMAVAGCPVRELTRDPGPVKDAFEPRGSRGVIRQGCGR